MSLAKTQATRLTESNAPLILRPGDGSGPFEPAMCLSRFAQSWTNPVLASNCTGPLGEISSNCGTTAVKVFEWPAFTGGSSSFLTFSCICRNAWSFPNYGCSLSTSRPIPRQTQTLCDHIYRLCRWPLNHGPKKSKSRSTMRSRFAAGRDNSPQSANRGKISHGLLANEVGTRHLLDRRPRRKEGP